MPLLPDKYREPLNVVRDSKGRVLFEAKAAANKSNWMLSVYVMAPNESVLGKAYAFPQRFYVVRVQADKSTNREHRRKTLHTMCDLAALQLGGVDYVLKEASR